MSKIGSLLRVSKSAKIAFLYPSDTNHPGDAYNPTPTVITEGTFAIVIDASYIENERLILVLTQGGTFWTYIRAWEAAL